MKLGERLVNMGALSKEQLGEALRSQLIHGGHLGTCLLELRFIGEDFLGNVLAEIFKVPYAAPEKFLDVPRSVTESLPVKLVDKHHAIPFALEKKTLQIAIVDPSNLRALDELAFAAGRKIRSWVAPEARIFSAMERYYNIPRRPRYITISRDLDRPSELATRSASPRPPLVEMQDSDAPPEGRARAEEKPPLAEVIEDLDERLTEILCAAESAEQLADAVLDYASKGLPRSMLFSVRSKHATLLNARGLDVDPERKANLKVSVTSDPPFKLLLGDDHYRGPVPSDPFNRSFYGMLDTEVPSEIILLPGHVDDQLEVVLYGDAGVDGEICGDTHDYRKLVRNLALGLKLIQIKEQIRSQ